MTGQVRVGGYAGQVLAADAVGSADAPALAGSGDEVGGVTSTDTRFAEESLGDLTKAELYEKAQDADIDGRSNMTRDELIAALEE